MKYGVVVFPGSNCDHDTIYTMEHILKQKVEKLWHKETDLKGCDFIFLPGGFSYGDYLRSGAIAQFSPIMDEVIRFADKGGYLMGICNGFQILCETGLLDGVLLHNNSRKFICENVHLKVASETTILTNQIDSNSVLKVPIAHGEGKFFAGADKIKRLEDNDQILFRYCDADGEITESANPNGSTNNIAGITNKGRNVFGMMPHPERASDPLLKNTDGLQILASSMQLAGII